jgi:hypothetical protein
MGEGDPELAAEVVCAIARSVLDADPERRRTVPLGNTVTRLLATRDEVPEGDPDHDKLMGLASAVQRARDGDADALDQLSGLVRGVREWFGLRN